MRVISNNDQSNASIKMIKFNILEIKYELPIFMFLVGNRTMPLTCHVSRFCRETYGFDSGSHGKSQKPHGKLTS